VRSTTFLFTTLCTSVQVLGEKLGQSHLSQNICAGHNAAPRHHAGQSAYRAAPRAARYLGVRARARLPNAASRLPNVPRPKTPWILRRAMRRTDRTHTASDRQFVAVFPLCIVPRPLNRRASSSTCIAYKRPSSLPRALEHRRPASPCSATSRQ
jgi:hypothetical protein